MHVVFACASSIHVCQGKTFREQTWPSTIHFEVMKLDTGNKFFFQKRFVASDPWMTKHACIFHIAVAHVIHGARVMQRRPWAGLDVVCSEVCYDCVFLDVLNIERAQ